MAQDTLIQEARSADPQMQDGETSLPRVVFAGLASCFGCQINFTNVEQHLTEVLGQIDVRYWQLTSSDPMPEDFDVAVIEGAVTTEASADTVRRLRDRADVVITIGACAATAGVPGMAVRDYEGRARDVYAPDVPAACGDMIAPRPVKAVVDVDFEVSCCPADPYDVIDVLQQALYRSNKMRRSSTLCGECKRNERGCFYGRGVMCLGLVTRSGCGARCPNLGRPCNGCAGLSPDANLESARAACEKAGISTSRFDVALQMFNQRLLLEDEEAEAEQADAADAADTAPDAGAAVASDTAPGAGSADAADAADAGDVADATAEADAADTTGSARREGGA